MHIYHEWEANGKRYKAVFDDDYQTRGSYALDTPEETKAAEDEEIEKICSGEWVALGVIVSEFLPFEHCKTCKCEGSDWRETLSLWGIVVENSRNAIEAFVRDGM